MLEKEIKFIYDFNSNLVKELGLYFTFEELHSNKIHPSLVKFISAEIDYQIFEDRRNLLKNSAFDYSGEKINEYFSLIADEIKRTKRLSYDDVSEILQQAIDFNAKFLTTPRKTLLEFLFDSATVKNVPEIKQGLNYIYYYKYLKDIILNYFKQKNLITISKEEFEKLLEKIDAIGIDTHLNEIIATAVNSISDFFNIGRIPKDKIPLALLDQFLYEKNLVTHRKVLRLKIPNTKSMYSTSKLVSILKDVKTDPNDFMEKLSTDYYKTEMTEEQEDKITIESFEEVQISEESLEPQVTSDETAGQTVTETGEINKQQAEQQLSGSTGEVTEIGNRQINVTEPVEENKDFEPEDFAEEITSSKNEIESTTLNRIAESDETTKQETLPEDLIENETEQITEDETGFSGEDLEEKTEEESVVLSETGNDQLEIKETVEKIKSGMESTGEPEQELESYPEENTQNLEVQTGENEITDLTIEAEEKTDETAELTAEINETIVEENEGIIVNGTEEINIGDFTEPIENITGKTDTGFDQNQMVAVKDETQEEVQSEITETDVTASGSTGKETEEEIQKAKEEQFVNRKIEKWFDDVFASFAGEQGDLEVEESSYLFEQYSNPLTTAKLEESLRDVYFYDQSYMLEKINLAKSGNTENITEPEEDFDLVVEDEEIIPELNGIETEHKVEPDEEIFNENKEEFNKVETGNNELPEVAAETGNIEITNGEKIEESKSIDDELTKTPEPTNGTHENLIDEVAETTRELLDENQNDLVEPETGTTGSFEHEKNMVGVESEEILSVEDESLIEEKNEIKLEELEDTSLKQISENLRKKDIDPGINLSNELDDLEMKYTLDVSMGDDFLTNIMGRQPDEIFSTSSVQSQVMESGEEILTEEEIENSATVEKTGTKTIVATKIKPEEEISIDENKPQEKTEVISLEEPRRIQFGKITQFKEMTNIIRVIFDYDMEDFENILDKISKCKGNEEAEEIINKYYEANHINPTAKEALMFKSLIAKTFNSA